jgi:hypothetical protein
VGGVRAGASSSALRFAFNIAACWLPLSVPTTHTALRKRPALPMPIATETLDARECAAAGPCSRRGLLALPLALIEELAHLLR